MEADNAVSIGGREADSGAPQLVRHWVHPLIEWRHTHRWCANEDAADGLRFETRHIPPTSITSLQKTKYLFETKSLL